ncbi:MAG: outer membrane beta-barrel protein [Verrucomicrobia bacterium]|nr:outer membrane beta-barrel protein [Verrucomicrobiota bacterium]
MRTKNRKTTVNRSVLAQLGVGACLGGALLSLGSPGGVQAQGVDSGKVDRLEQENKDLRTRLDALESVARKEGLLPSGSAPNSLKVLSETTLSGFVQASYFYNTSEPSDRASDGYLWNTTHNSFSLNKVKVTLANPAVERSGDAWDAAYKLSLIWGEDSSVLNTGSPSSGFEAVREAYIELNAPIGTGLNIKAGQLISLLNYESGDGGAANSNFSQGFQWFVTGNGPSAGVQLGYTFTDWLEAKVRVQNGMYAGPVDRNEEKTVIGSLGFKPSAAAWFNLIGFGGQENPGLEVKGGSVLAGYQISEKAVGGLELDFFNFDFTGGGSADLWSVGGWFGYDFSPKVGMALRAEYLDDGDGGGLKGITLPGRPGSAITSTDAAGNISSVALTLNLKPVPSIKIQPEIRYDRTTYKGGFDGEDDRFLVGAGVSYLF